MNKDFDPPFGGQEEHMETQTQDPPAPAEGAAQEQKSVAKLPAWRAAPKKGIPTSGLMLVVGHPKSGKSKFVASWPDSVVLETERGGADRIDGRVVDCENKAQFNDALLAALADKSVKTIVIDTIDELALWVGAEIAQKKGLASMNDRKQGVDGYALWGEFKDKLEAFTKAMKECGKLVIFVAHCKPPEKSDTGAVITPAGINISGKAASYMAAQAEAIAYAYKQELGSGTAYKLTFRGGPLALWGSRIKELNDKTFDLPEKDPYSAILAAFGPANGNGASAPAEAQKKPAKARAGR